jgi:hypothetical protein
VAVFAAVLVISWLLLACGDSQDGTPAGTYTLTVTATSASVQRTLNITLIVR